MSSIRVVFKNIDDELGVTRKFSNFEYDTPYERKLHSLVSEFYKDLNPVAKEVRFNLNTGYETNGWQDDNLRWKFQNIDLLHFEHLLYLNKFPTDWVCQLNKGDNFNSDTISFGKENYLYLHPEGFSGYLTDEMIIPIEKCIKETFDDKLNSINISNNVYDIHDRDYQAYFLNKIELVDKLIFTSLQKHSKWSENTLSQYIHDTLKIHRIDSRDTYSPDNVLYGLVFSEVFTLKRYGILKEKDHFLSVDERKAEKLFGSER